MKILSNSILQLSLRKSLKFSCLPRHFCTDVKSPYTDIPCAQSFNFSLMWNGGPKMFHKYIDKLHAKHGPAFYNDSPEGQKMLFVADPVLNLEVLRCEGKYPIHIIPESWKLCLEELDLKRGLFFMDGEEWKKNRRVMAKLMGPRNSVEHLFPILNLAAIHLINNWKDQLPLGANLEKAFYEWSSETAALAFIGAPLDAVIEDGKCESIPKEFYDVTYSIFQNSVYFYTFSPLIAQKLNLRVWKKFRSSIQTALTLGKDIVETAIQNQRENATTHPCIMEEMLRTEKLSDDTISRIIIDMILTAGDTTSLAALWTFYVLGRHKEIGRRCQKEVQEVLGDKTTINFSDMTKMRYLGHVCKEAMRLYPVVPFVTRKTASYLTYKNYYIPNETMVATSMYTMLRNKDVFPEPNSFNPDRWNRDNPNISPDIRSAMSASFIPFGHGARNCVAKYLAKAQVQVLMAHLLLNFDWEVLKDVEPILRLITVPAKNLTLEIKRKH